MPAAPRQTLRLAAAFLVRPQSILSAARGRNRVFSFNSFPSSLERTCKLGRPTTQRHRTPIHQGHGRRSALKPGPNPSFTEGRDVARGQT